MYSVRATLKLLSFTICLSEQTIAHVWYGPAAVWLFINCTATMRFGKTNVLNAFCYYDFEGTDGLLHE